MKKKNNKGFSLVELIVTITIMAVLIGILAPMYFKYVERARRQTCYTNVDNIARAVQMMAYTDSDVMAALQDAADPTTGDVTEYVKANMDISFPNCPSKGEYTVTLDPVTNHISMSCSMEEHELPGETEDPGTE